MEIVVVSHNPERVRELKSILHELLPDVHCISETTQNFFEETSFEKGAETLAINAVKAFGKPCLADDSGLILPSFMDEKLRVRREKLQQSGVFLPDTKNVLKDFENIDDSSRTAFLECSLCFATPEKGIVKTATCRMEGFIAAQGKGSSTFDFASIFIKNDYNKTIAELSAAVQSKISHRRKAFEKLLPFLKKYK